MSTNASKGLMKGGTPFVHLNKLDKRRCSGREGAVHIHRAVQHHGFGSEMHRFPAAPIAKILYAVTNVVTVEKRIHHSHEINSRC